MRTAPGTQSVAAILAVTLLAVCVTTSFGGESTTNMRARRHVVAEAGLPASYARLANPLSITAETLAEGARLYGDNCRTCHGPGGRGDGEGGTNPPPPSLRRPAFEGLAAPEAYLMWAISEGGAALGTQMPAYKLALGEEERWKLVAFIAADFPRSH